ncbi:MAG TPA: Gfo/Idh/MocA family oxidoreductase [Microvirga sp.]|jgi:predicted homoserine dehydrogenase-like protein|nr:Gfo/Idh/MocA family oxidoreductase [Microvirga sp.]
MNLAAMLRARAESGSPIRVGLIGAGKFGAMFLAQARLTPGIHILGIADLNPQRARDTCKRVGWSEEQFSAASFEEARRTGATFITDSNEALIQADGLDILIEATGSPEAGIHHCLKAIEAGRHIIMVNVEADVVAGPLLAHKARQAGLIYSLAYGDQPAIICEHVDWARACGFTVVSAGKGTRYHPSFHASTPDTVWENFGLSPELAERAGNNPKMFNSFIDGTKSSIEMTAVCNATGLTPQPNGLGFPPASCDDLAEICKPRSEGGTLSHEGTTEVVSSLNRDMTPIEHHLQIGTYVVVKAEDEYVRHCIEEYRFYPDRSFRYSAMYRPAHLIGLELGISVASIGLRGEPTGTPTGFRSDVVATAKRDLKEGEILDGEGGYCVWGKQMPAGESLRIGALPLGLAQNVRLKTAKRAGEHVSWADVEIDEQQHAVRVRREMEAMFAADAKSRAA